MKRFLLFLIVACFLSTVGIQGISAQTGEAKTPERSDFIFIPDVYLWGGEVNLGFRHLSFVEGLDTIFWLRLGAQYGTEYFYRNPDGSLYYDVTDGWLSVYPPDSAPAYSRLNTVWGLGLEQGILWNDRLNENLLASFLYYFGRFDKHFPDQEKNQLIFDSLLPDAEGILQHSFMLGFYLDDVKLDKINKTKNGIYLETSAQWGPRFLGNDFFGEADFIRFNFTGEYYLPILDAAPESKMNIFSLYLADFFAADFVTGSSIPINIRKSFGGLSRRLGLGGAVRGFGPGRFDANLKLVNNVELRANLPAIIFRDIVPGILLYFDSGYYSIIEGAEASSVNNGLLLSTGAGIYLNILDFAQFTAYSHIALNRTKVNGAFWTPFAFAFTFHF